METQLTTAAITTTDSIALCGCVAIAVGINKRYNKPLETYNPTHAAYEELLNDPAYKLLVDPAFLEKYNLRFNIAVNEGDIYSYFGFIAQHKEKSNYVIVFRGTQNDFEMKADQKFDPVSFNEYSEGQVPEGFYSIFENSSIETLPGNSKKGAVSLKELAGNVLHFLPGAQNGITVTGHSLGAAVATYFTAAAAASPLNKDLDFRLCTFASPMTGDLSFTNTFNQSVGDCKRIFNAEDTVPKTPVYLAHFKNVYTHVNGGFQIDSTNDPNVNHAHLSKDGLACAHQLPVYMYLLQQLEGNHNPDIISAGGDGRCRVG